ncbi:hypothetical protein DUI87_01080 [Hirundo rustica rustica]|uniref:ribonuclease H n=1 Tax=Hirundo rustica rustica TaxID=333673 RepID=A0A3M0L8G7_HIRRU|nr:hypothetical protein DUI87_01080 [Hirundo rustica rustica]
MKRDETEETVLDIAKKLRTYADAVHGPTHARIAALEMRMRKLEDKIEENHKELKQDILQISAVQVRGSGTTRKRSLDREGKSIPRAKLWSFLRDCGENMKRWDGESTDAMTQQLHELLDSKTAFGIAAVETEGVKQLNTLPGLSENPSSVGLLKVEEQQVPIATSIVHCRQYRTTRDAVIPIHKMIRELETQGVVSKAHSPFNSPIWPVRKSDGGWRLTVDYRALNEVTPPLSAAVLDMLELQYELESKAAKWYATIDIANAFFSIPLAAECRPQFAFTWRGVQYTWNRLPQGWKHSPTICHGLIQAALEKSEAPEHLQYIDDIIVWGNTAMEVFEKGEKIIQILLKAGFAIKKSKVKRPAREIQFLRIALITQRARIGNPNRPRILEIITNWPEDGNFDLTDEEEQEQVTRAEEAPPYNQLPAEETRYALFTDSSCRVVGMNRKWKAAVWSPTRQVAQATEGEGESSQLAELKAVQLALDIAEREKWPKLYLYTDSWMVVNALWGWLEKWKKANWQRRGKPIWAADEWKDIVTQVEKLPVKVRHVDAHVPKSQANAEHRNNEQVDQAAKINVSKIDLDWQHKGELFLARWAPDASGHQGRDATYKWARDREVDLTMDSISQVIHDCETCAAIKQAKRVKSLWYSGRWSKYKYGEPW